MRKPLSLNTQLSKLRLVNNLLKQSLSGIMQTQGDSTHCDKLRQVIYSLRDIQYDLRGLKLQIHRSAHTQKMSIEEIRTYLNSIIEAHKSELETSYWQNIETANSELISVEMFLQNRIIKDNLF